MNQRRDWTVDAVVGVVAGGVVGAIIAVNFIITIGIGYDVSIPDVFRDNIVSGIVTVVILIAGPVIGVWLMRRARRKREARQ
jgi:hypothetical protein